MIHVVGLGPGQLKYITLESLELIKNADKIILRTKEHPAAVELAEQGIEYVSCDDFYEKYDSFLTVYQEIVKFCLQENKKYSNIVYAVPGSPLVAEKTVQLLREQAKCKIYPAMSFLDLAYNALQIDAAEGVRVLDALQFSEYIRLGSVPLILTQVYNRQVASDVKLTLMEHYPDDTPVTFMRNLGLTDEVIRVIPLYELDRQTDINHLTCVYIAKAVAAADMTQLADTVRILREPDGCMWDREQTHDSIRHNFIEEVYEVIEAIDTQDDTLLCEELGDVLLQVLFHAQIATEKGAFTLQDVIDGIDDKLVRRHPHVFAQVNVADSAEIIANWEKIKSTEKKQRKSVLDGITKGLPALMASYKMQDKAAKVGFDWDDIQPVYHKVEEELQELRQANSPQEKEKELGDLLFAVVNLARHLKIIPELALNTSNKSFIRRFSFVEQCVKNSNRNWSDFTLEQLDEFWNQAKANGL